MTEPGLQIRLCFIFEEKGRKTVDDIYIGGNHSQNRRPDRSDNGHSSGDIYISGSRNNRSRYSPPADDDRLPFDTDFDEPEYAEPKRKQPPERAQRSSAPPQRPKQPTRSKRKKHPFRRLLAVLMIPVLLFAGVVGMVYNMFSSVDYNETGHKDNVFLDSNQLVQNRAVKNILLLGVDRRNADDSSRSDTMLMVSIDTVHKKIKLTSFLRDSYVYIPEKKKSNRLNAACTYGGAQMVMDTIEYNFNVRIDHYMLVDFSMFEDIINGLDGVSVDITEKEAKYMRNVVHLKNIQAGENIPLNGKEALWYCRIRKLDSDFMRTERQRKVMTALIQKAKKTNVFSLYGMGKDVVSQIETDMSPSDLTALTVSGVLRYLSYDVEQCSIPTEGTWQSKRINGNSVLSLDLEANSKYLKEFIYEE